MFIEIDKTADPDRLEFRPGRAVLGTDEIVFEDAAAAARSPLAARLFEVEGVAAVALGADVVGVRKARAADWQILKPAVLGVIMEHFLSSRPVLLPGEETVAEDFAPADAARVAEIKAVLERRIRPGLAAEGGDVVFRGYRDGVVTLELRAGAFDTPLFSVKIRIENTLRHEIGALESVDFIAPAPAEPAALDLDDPEVAAVHEMLDSQVNPAIAAHGGFIALLDVKDHVAYIRLEGGCQGCGLADVTLKQGVEVALKRAVPSITAVRDTTDHASGTNPYYQPDKGGVSPL